MALSADLERIVSFRLPALGLAGANVPSWVHGLSRLEHFKMHMGAR